MPTVRLLHISDLHFKPENADRRSRFEAPREKKFLAALRRFKAKYEEDEWPTGLIVSGDLVDGGNPAAFPRAVKFIRNVADEFNIPHPAIFVVPGNHDVNWDPTLQHFTERFESFIEHTRGFKTPAISDDEVIPFAPRFCPLLSNGRKDIFIQLTLLVSPIYSGIRDQERIEKLTEKMKDRLGDFDDGQRDHIFSALADAHQSLDVAFIGEEQRDALSQQKPKPSEKTIKIAVLHHHLLPDTQIDNNEFAAVVDSGKTIETLIDSGYDLVLHGHRHNTQLVEFTKSGKKTLSVYAAPAAFEGPNAGFTIIDIHGANASRYVTIQRYPVSDRQSDVPAPVQLARPGRIQTKFAEIFSNFARPDEDELLLVMESLQKAFEWRNGGHGRELFKEAWDEFQRELGDLSEQRLRIRTPYIWRQFETLIKISNKQPKTKMDGMRAVSANDLEYWLQSETPNTEPFKYCERLRAFRGPKTRVLTTFDERNLRPEQDRDAIKVVEAMMKRDGFRVRTVLERDVPTGLREDFAIFGDFAAYVFDNQGGPVRGLNVFLRPKEIEKFRRDWLELNNHVQWDSDRDGPFAMWLESRRKLTKGKKSR